MRESSSESPPPGRYGFRKDGSQLFVRISSNHPWSDLANELLLTEIFGRLQALGL